MENNLLRIILFVLLFFLLTTDYTALLRQVMLSFDDESDTGGTTSDNQDISHRQRYHQKQKTDETGDAGSALSSAIEEQETEETVLRLEEFLDDSDHYSVDQKNVRRDRIINAVKNSCLPKLICELNASENKDNLTPSELGLLNLIRDTSISATAEVTSKYHFAAHMGQLIAGIEGTGCHNFYPDCPIQGFRIGSQATIDKPAV